MANLYRQMKSAHRFLDSNPYAEMEKAQPSSISNVMYE
jgi:hypothetical protein